MLRPPLVNVEAPPAVGVLGRVDEHSCGVRGVVVLVWAYDGVACELVVEFLVVAPVSVVLPEIYVLLNLGARCEDAGLLIGRGRDGLDGRVASGLFLDALGVEAAARVALDAESLYLPVLEQADGEGLRISIRTPAWGVTKADERLDSVIEFHFAPPRGG